MKAGDVDLSQEKLWKSLLAAHARRGPAETLELARRYLAVYPKNGAAWAIYGRTLTDIARYKEGAAALQKAIRLIPPGRRFFPYMLMGRLFREKGNLPAAERWYRKAVKANSKTTVGLICLGAVLAKQNRYSEAKRFQRRAIKLGVGDVDEAYLNLGLVLRAEGDYGGAIQCFDKALELDPKFVAAKRSRADALRALRVGKDGA